MCQGTVVSRQLEFISDRGRQDRGHRLAPLGPPDPLRQTDAYTLTLESRNVCSHTYRSEGRGVGSGSAVLLTNRIHPSRAESRPLLEPGNTTERVYAWLYLVLGGHSRTPHTSRKPQIHERCRYKTLHHRFVMDLSSKQSRKVDFEIGLCLKEKINLNKKKKEKNTPHVCSITKP